MGRYQNMYGLKPIGPHRRLADELFAGVSVACQTCSGRGLLDVNAGEAWIPCQDCFGMGLVWTCTPEEVQALRRQVLETFPDAGVETQVDLLSGIDVLDLANSTIENLNREALGGEGNEQVL